ncbi:hypothetical protein MRX96_033157 [Rhipicephalus microplus]
MAAAAKKPVLVQLDIDSIDGGTSPWFSGMGRMFMAMVTTDPENADLFGQLASEGSMGTLVSYLDTEQAYGELHCPALLHCPGPHAAVIVRGAPGGRFRTASLHGQRGPGTVPDVRAGPGRL